MAVQFRILGPIEVELDGGRAARVPRGRARSLLALLLVRHGAAVHADRIADELWDGAGRDHARNAVQIVASRLRAVLGEDLVVSRGGGYALQLPPAAGQALALQEAKGNVAGAAAARRLIAAVTPSAGLAVRGAR